MDDESRQKFLDVIRAKIAGYGHMVAAIGADPDANEPQFAYTIGLGAKHGFEFAISGLPFEDMHNILNKLARRVGEKALAPTEGLFVEGAIENGYLVRLKETDPSWDMFYWALEAQGLTELKVWQAQFPDRDGRWPDDEGCDLSPYTQTDFTLPKAA
jgi:hypothetical protein